MKLKILKTTFFLIATLSTYSQQIGTGFEAGLSNADFNQPLKSGVYELNSYGINADESFPWQHLFVMRHSNQNNNFQLQLSSTFLENDRLFFRKVNNSTNSTWYEVATRGANTFNGNQNLIGSQILTDDLIIGRDGEISTISGPTNSGAIQIKTNGSYGGSTNRYLRLGWKDGNAIFYPVLSINDDLNVGIGSTNPDSKLTVKGKIHAEEVKIDLAVPADYVFEKYYLGKSSLKPDYTLLSLSEVEKFTEENHHLPNVPSAKEIKENGLMVGEMSNVLLQKIEELTLYAIKQEKKNNEQAENIKNLDKQIELLKRENEAFKLLSERLSKLENLSKQ